MEKTIYGYIWRYSARRQTIVTLMAVGSFPFLYAFYELPKRIVNEAIDGKSADFPVQLAGYSLDQIPYLAVLCGLFFGLIGGVFSGLRRSLVEVKTIPNQGIKL